MSVWHWYIYPNHLHITANGSFDYINLTTEMTFAFFLSNQPVESLVAVVFEAALMIYHVIVRDTFLGADVQKAESIKQETFYMTNVLNCELGKI